MNLRDVILDLKELIKRQIFSSQTPAEGIPVKVQDDSTNLSISCGGVYTIKAKTSLNKKFTSHYIGKGMLLFDLHPLAFHLFPIFLAYCH
jgi:hypothetical protein